MVMTWLLVIAENVRAEHPVERNASGASGDHSIEHDGVCILAVGVCMIRLVVLAECARR